MRSDILRLYFGAGGGIVRTKEDTTAAGVKGTKTENAKMIDMVGGAEIRITKTISFFIEPRYVKGDANVVSGLAAHAGLSFEMR
jgi:hypothetical protein